MDKAARSAEQTLLVLSPAYLLSDYAFAEWAAAFRYDPRGTHRSMLPVRIEPCEVEGFLGLVGYIDLVSLEEAQARERLLEGVQQERVKPAAVAFPGYAIPHESPAHVVFPGSVPMIWNVPYLRNPHFTGRDELLDRLAQQLAPEAQEQVTSTRRVALTQPQALKGLGGIGKTQIAIEYAYRSRDLGQYTYIFWVNASEETLLTSFAALADLLPVFPVKGETDQWKLMKAIIQWLEQCQERWLLIFDNADDVALVSNYLPQQGSGNILLTTRAHAVGSLAVSINVEEMDRWEGTLFLLRRAQLFEHTSIMDSSDEEVEIVNEARGIVDALESFPLALDQAAAYIEETNCNLADYLQIYQDHRKDLLSRRGFQITNYPDSVATTWSLSFQKVEQANPAAAELLRLCAFLAPDKIPEELIREGAVYWSSQLQQAVSDAFAFNQMLEELLKFSLVKHLAEDHMLSIHRLVQAVQVDMMEQEAQRQWAERVIRAVDKVFPDKPQDTATWSQCLRYLDQAQACYELIERYGFAFIEAASVLSRTGRYLYDHALYARAQPLYQRALTIYEQQLGSSHPHTASNLNNLAALYDAQGKYGEAELLYKRALAIREQALGTEHPDTAQSLNDLAWLYYNEGKYEQAELLYKRTLAIRERQLGTEHPYTAESLNDLAWLYDHQGRYEEAEALYYVVWEDEGCRGEAEPLYQRALMIREGQLGAEHPDTAQSLDNLALLYDNQGRYGEAEPLRKSALAIRERQLGAEHPDTAQSLNDLAWLYDHQGRYEEAEPLYQRALMIREEQLGAEHPHTAESLNDLAVLYRHWGKYREAEPLHERALAIRERQLGAEHPRTAESLNNLAELYNDQGKYAEAEPLLRRALAIREQRLGPEHPDTATSLNSLAQVYKNQRRYTDAEPLYQRALAICERWLGAEHPRTRTTRANYTALLCAMKQGDAASS
jgi:tetratricopeptide (TPR) repeat protein